LGCVGKGDDAKSGSSSATNWYILNLLKLFISWAHNTLYLLLLKKNKPKLLLKVNMQSPARRKQEIFLEKKW